MSIYAKIIKKVGNFILNVEFEAENEVLALLGCSGSGKSMTLKCIAGIIEPDKGRIVVDGVTLFDSDKKINMSPQERHIGLLFQNYALFPNMTVEQNLSSAFRRSDGQNDRKERLQLILESYFLTGLEKHYPSQLSGGQQQRVALARIMASEPKIIMLDEPLSALDSYLRWQVERELAEILSKFQGTTLYVSHNRDEVYSLCHKICVINGGYSEKVSTVDEFFNSPSTLASAFLSGCKNYSKMEIRSDNTLQALNWQVLLKCSDPIPEDATHIGVRAHNVLPFYDGDENQNKVICRVLEVRNDLFSIIFTLVPLGADPKNEFAQIRMELPSFEDNTVQPGDIMAVKIPQNAIMPLKNGINIKKLKC